MEFCFSIGYVIDSRHDLQKARFTSAIGANHTNFCTGKKGQGHVIQDDLVAMGFTSFLQCINEFGHGIGA